MLLHDLDSVKYSVSMFQSFQYSSGLKMNIEKTQATYMGSLMDNDYYSHDLSWIKTPPETLGIVITDNTDNYKHNF